MKKLLLLPLLVLLSACGTTSGLKDAKNNDIKMSLASYNKVIIMDLEDGTSKRQDDQYIISEGKKFSNILQSKIETKKIFSKIDRNVNSNDNALLIEGEIIKCEKGNAALKLVVGCGAGSTSFNAKIYIKDNRTKELLARINTDEGSWAPGGIISACQNIDSIINTSAGKIANEIARAKQR